MDGARAERGKRGEVLRRGVALVYSKTVAGMETVVFESIQPVTRDFGKDTGGGDGTTPAIAT